MKKIFLLLMLIEINLLTEAQCYGGKYYLSGYYNCENYDEWIMVFEDEFNFSDIDNSIWQNDSGTLYCNNEVEYYTNGNNIEVNNGILELVAKNESVYERAVPWLEDNEELFCQGISKGLNKRWFNYTSGRIISKQQFIYGKFEIKCKVPSIKKLWPAFWLNGNCSQEIDIFEFMSESENPYYANREIDFTYHRKFNCNDENKVSCNSGKCFPIWSTDMSEDYHIYSVEWDENIMIWRIDGNEVWRIFKWHNLNGQEMLLCGDKSPNYYPFDRIFPQEIPMSVIANLAVKPNPTASFPTQMYIDYIRVYQKINSSKIVNLCSKDDIKGSTVAGKEIVIGGENCNISIEQGQFLDLISKDKVTLKSGFSALEGSKFSAKAISPSTFKKNGNIEENSLITNYEDSIESKNYFDKLLLREQFQIFPNPATSAITIVSTTFKNYYTIRIFDIKGQLVYQSEINKLKLVDINISNIPKGIYVIVIDSQENNLIQKLIIL